MRVLRSTARNVLSSSAAGLPLLLLEERLGVQGAGRHRGEAKDGQDDQRRNNDLHDGFSYCELDAIDTMSPVIDTRERRRAGVIQA
jgi:hypothetical protein